MRRPPILLTRPIYEWINQVAKKHRELIDLQPTQEESYKLPQLIEAEFTRFAFGLEGIDLSKEQIERVARLSIDEMTEMPQNEREIASQIEALRIVRALAENQDREVALTPELLLKMRSPFGDAEFRKSPGDANRKTKSMPPEHLYVGLQSAFFWFTAESFLELNPIEQAAIVLLRMIEIQPFEDANDRMAITAASLFLMRSELPPLIIRTDRFAVYRAAVEESFQSNTKPMVELVAQATEETLNEALTVIIESR